MLVEEEEALEEIDLVRCLLDVIPRIVEDANSEDALRVKMGLGDGALSPLVDGTGGTCPDS